MGFFTVAAVSVTRGLAITTKGACTSKPMKSITSKLDRVHGASWRIGYLLLLVAACFFCTSNGALLFTGIKYGSCCFLLLDSRVANT